MLSPHCIQNPKLQQTEFSFLQAIGKGIKIIDRIRPAFSFISQLYLDHNNLITLNGIEQFENLQIFTFNFNYVGQIKQLGKIRNRFFVKQISYIGNPMESDLRSNYQYLATNYFSNLEGLNRDNGNRILRKFMEKRDERRQKIFDYGKYSNSQGKTQRYQQQLDNNLHQYTQRLSIKTKQNKKISLDTTKTKTKQRDKKQQKSQIKNTEATTTGMRSHPSEKSWTRTGHRIGHGERQVKIKPFSQHEQLGQGNGGRQQIQGEEQLQIQMDRERERGNQEQNENQQFQRSNQQQQQLGEQSSIKEERGNLSLSLFNGTGYFDRPKSRHQIIENSIQIFYRNFTLQFLEQQKQQIAIAFRIRFVKEKVFQIFAKMRIDKKQDQRLKKKAWGAIKLYSCIDKISKGNTQIKEKVVSDQS